MTRKEIVAYNFRRLREAVPLTPKEAADLGGVPVTYIYQVQGGKVSFGRDAQDKWAPIFRCKIVDFFKEPSEIKTELPQSLYPLLREVVEVMQSCDEGCKLALEQNIHTFVEKVREQSTLRQLTDQAPDGGKRSKRRRSSAA